MKVSIDSINSAGIRAAMARDSYTTAELLGTFNHPIHDGSDWIVRLYRAADSLVFDTNGDPVWENTDAFAELLDEYKIDITRTQRPGSPDGSLATETRKPGSLE